MPEVASRQFCAHQRELQQPGGGGTRVTHRHVTAVTNRTPKALGGMDMIEQPVEHSNVSLTYPRVDS